MRRSPELPPLPPEEDILKSAAGCVTRDAVRELVAVKAEWNEPETHLRLTYYLRGSPEEVDFETLQMGEGEIYAAWWSFINIGTVYVFDGLLIDEALRGGNLIFQRD